MIIYGSRMYGAKNVVHAHGVCEHCGRLVRHKSYDARKFGHLYFIPLIPAGGPVRVLKECPSCNHGVHVPQDQAAAYYGEIESLMPKCVAAAIEGDHEFVIDASGETSPTGPFLTTAIETLYIFGSKADIPEILDILRDGGAEYEYLVARSAHEDLTGDHGTAEQSMLDAAAILSDAPYPLVMLAQFAGRRGDPHRQLELLHQTNNMQGGQNVELMLQMADIYEALNQYDQMIEMMDRCIALVPELAEDKKFMKLHKKYSKKAAKQAR